MVDIMGFTTALSYDMGMMPGQYRTPKMLMRDLRTEIDALRADIVDIEGDLAQFADIKRLKAWLEGYRIGSLDHGGDPWY